MWLFSGVPKNDSSHWGSPDQGTQSTSHSIFCRLCKTVCSKCKRYGCSKAEPKFSTRRRLPSRGRRTAKIADGHYLYLQTQFGADRCTQFRVIVVTDPQTHTDKQTNPQTGPILQYTAPLSLARSVKMSAKTFANIVIKNYYHCCLLFHDILDR